MDSTRASLLRKNTLDHRCPTREENTLGRRRLACGKNVKCYVFPRKKRKNAHTGAQASLLAKKLHATLPTCDENTLGRRCPACEKVKKTPSEENTLGRRRLACEK